MHLTLKHREAGLQQEQQMPINILPSWLFISQKLQLLEKAMLRIRGWIRQRHIGCDSQESGRIPHLWKRKRGWHSMNSKDPWPNPFSASWQSGKSLMGKEGILGKVCKKFPASLDLMHYGTKLQNMAFFTSQEYLCLENRLPWICQYGLKTRRAISYVLICRTVLGLFRIHWREAFSTTTHGLAIPTQKESCPHKFRELDNIWI